MPGGVEGGACPAGYRYAQRLQSITNNHGYQLKLTYATNTLDDLNPATSYDEWSRLTSVRAINNAQEYCDPTADSCSFSSTWPEATFAETPITGGMERTITNSAGETTRYTSDSSYNVTGIRPPGASGDLVTVAYGANGVSSLSRAGISFSYTVSISGTTRTTTVTDPDGGARVYVTDTASLRLSSFTDELSRTTTYGYDSDGRLTSVTYPLGNQIQYTYDARGNVTETRRVAASGSGLPDIVTTASFDTSCSNPLTCNRPNSTTDARGNTTDYTYSATHGGVLTATLPSPGGGAPRPQTRTAYTAYQAYYRQSGGGGPIASGTNVTLPTQTSACSAGTAPSCLSGADETRTVIDWGPQSSGTANNLLPVSVTNRDGGGSLVATSTATYDDIGNLLTVDGPLSGTDDTTTFRYDALRRRVGAISPDPDGGGSMLRRAQRTTYASSGGSTGLVTQVDQGTVTGTSNADWAAFVTLQSVALTYDTNRRLVRQALLSATPTTEAVQDLSYDDLGRPECVAVRMNPSAWGTLTAGCTAQSAGSHGPDRIGRTVYDLAGQVTQSQQAVGTALQTNVATSSYTANGRLETLTDGENNRTTYVYDGHDRLSRTRMPSTTQGAGTSSTTDYEELTYETTASGTRTSGTIASRRLRDATSIGYTYDALGRLTLKDTPNASYFDPDVTYAYDLLGRVTAITSPNNHNLAFAYDALGRRTSETSYYGTKTLQYDLAGRLTRLTWPDSFYVSYDHLVTGEVTHVRENGATSGIGVLAMFAYDDLGRRTSLTRGNGTSAAYSYDAASRLSQLVENMSGTTNDLTLGFSYNPAAQITGNTRSNDLYSYTARVNGNAADTNNGLNQVTASGSTSLYYDARGNVEAIYPGSDPPTGYNYTSENRLWGTAYAALLYDAGGRLMMTLPDWRDWDNQTRLDMLGDQQLITELDINHNVLRRYVHGPGVDEPLVWYEARAPATAAGSTPTSGAASSPSPTTAAR